MARVSLSYDGLSGPATRSHKSLLVRADMQFVAYDMLALWDFLSVAVLGYASAFVHEAVSGPEVASPENQLMVVRFALLGAILATFVLRDVRTRVDLNVISVNHLISRTAQRFVLLVCLVLLAGFLTQVLRSVPRLWLCGWVASSFLAALGGRLLLVSLFRALMRRGMMCDRVALVGRGGAAKQMLDRIKGPNGQGVRLVATFDDVLGSDDSAAAGALDRLLALGRRGEVDRVILALPRTDEAKIIEIAYRLKALDVEVTYLSPLAGLTGGSVPTTQLAGTPLMVLTSRPFVRWGFFLKGVADRTLAFFSVVYLLPILALVSVAIRLDSPGPIIFRQRRHGWNGTEFDVYKFRTMVWAGTGHGCGEVQTARGDARVTRVGSFLRRTSLDELPQLFNVLEGHMSLVGPRPHPVVMRTEQRLGDEIIAEYSHRHRVKPGITGWAQINGHRGATETAEQVRQRVEHDIYYIDNWSLLFDLRIIAITPFRVLFQRANAF